jgi:hypothetical protein
LRIVGDLASSSSITCTDGSSREHNCSTARNFAELGMIATELSDLIAEKGNARIQDSKDETLHREVGGWRLELAMELNE